MVRTEVICWPCLETTCYDELQKESILSQQPLHIYCISRAPPNPADFNSYGIKMPVQPVVLHLHLLFD